MIPDAYKIQQVIADRDIVAFAHEILGMPTHEGQDYWLTNSHKQINVLKPANQWGKTTAEAIKHIYHAVVKPQLDRFNMEFEDRFSFKYITLNFGKTYEIARGVMEHVIDITEGKYLLADGHYNKSLLKGFAIVGIDEVPKLPAIKWWNNSKTLIRSYDGLGEAFKRLRLAYCSGDECGDIPELRLFVNGTLLPRLFFFAGSLDLVGTSQPKGLEYEEIAKEGEEDMKENGEQANHFVLSAYTNPEMAMVYRNDFMPKEAIREIEKIADPELKRQIIYGEHVDYGDHLYTFDEVRQIFKNELPWDPETGLSEAPEREAYYIFSVDMAATHDETSETCIRFNRFRLGFNKKVVYLKHRVVLHRAWKGESLPLSLQYEIIKADYRMFYNASPSRTYFVYDAGSLGGKNAGEAFRELKNTYPFPPKGKSYPTTKAEGMGKVKEVLGRGREFTINEKGQQVDKNQDWGGVEASPQLLELRHQLEISSKDDDKLKNDQYTSFMQGIHFIEMRAPKRYFGTPVRDFNVLSR